MNRYGLTRVHPIDIVCDGWKSDTVTLERYGWRFQEERDVYHRDIQLYAVKNGSKFFIKFAQEMLEDLHKPKFFLKGDPISNMAMSESHYEHFRLGLMPVYMEKSMEHEYEMLATNKYNVRDLFQNTGVFSDEAEVKEIYIPREMNIDEMLDSIIEKQAPIRRQAAERKRIIQITTDANVNNLRSRTA